MNRTALKIVSVLCIALCWFVVASCQPSVRYVRARGGDDAKAYYHRGNDFAKNKDYDRAIENYSRAIAINPKYAEAHNNRGAAYLDKKDKRQGCTDLQRACELGVCKGYDKTRQSGVCTDGISSQEVAEADRGDSGMRLDRPDRSDDYKDPVAPPPSAKQSQQVTPPPTPAPPRPTPAPTALPEQYAKADSPSEGSNRIVAPVKSAGKQRKTENVQQQPIHKAAQEYRDDECPSSAEYIAFSLNAARKRMEGFKAEDDFRVTAPGVFNIGCINKIHGLVYDREARDIIIVGKHEPKRAVVTLDDLVVVLRARFVHSKWPLVSIDPTPDTEKTNMQHVRFEGGIEDTQFGEDLFDADFRLKKIGMGLLPSSVDEVDSYWNLSLKDTSIQSGNFSIGNRFWFYPIPAPTTIRENVGALPSEGLKVAVFTEVLSAEINNKKIENFQNAAGDKFAESVSNNFDKLSMVHPSFNRTQVLEELVGLVRIMEDMDIRPDIDWWLKLNNYHVKKVPTRQNVEVLKRDERREDRYRMSGGAQLMSIAIRLNDGDVTALRDAVLKTRPKVESLRWTFIAGKWIIPTSGKLLHNEEIGQLLANAAFLYQQKRYDDSIAVYKKIIEFNPNLTEAYNGRGTAYGKKKEYDRAIEDLNKAIAINPNYADAYNNRGAAYNGKNEYDRAIEDFNKAIAINPNHVEPYNNRGAAYNSKKEYDRAIEDFNKAITINPNYDHAYNNRGNAYHYKKDYNRAIEDFNKTIAINPNYDHAYNGRGSTYYYKKEYNISIEDFNKAIAINPNYADAYNGRGASYIDLRDNIRGCTDFKRACELGICENYDKAKQSGVCNDSISNQKLPEDENKDRTINHNDAGAYYNLGNTFAQKQEYDRAIENYNKAIAINPKFAEAYTNRGTAYSYKKEYDKAIEDFNKAISIDPTLAEVYNGRGYVYNGNKDYDRAIVNFNKAIAINPNYAEAYYNRGISYYYKEEYNRAIEDYSKAIAINPNDAGAYYNRGAIYLNLGDKIRGCADVKRACELGVCENDKKAKQSGDCNDSISNRKLAEAEERIGRGDKNTINPNDAKAYNNSGKQFLLKVRIEQAGPGSPVYAHWDSSKIDSTRPIFFTLTKCHDKCDPTKLEGKTIAGIQDNNPPFKLNVTGTGNYAFKILPFNTGNVESDWVLFTVK